MLGHELQVAVALCRLSLGRLARHPREARRLDGRRFGMALGDRGGTPSWSYAPSPVNDATGPARASKEAGRLVGADRAGVLPIEADHLGTDNTKNGGNYAPGGLP